MQHSQLNQQPCSTALRFGYPFSDDKAISNFIEYLPFSEELIEWLYTPRYRVMDRPYPTCEGLFMLFSPNLEKAISGWEVSRDNLSLNELLPQVDADSVDILKLNRQIQIVEERHDAIFYNISCLYKTRIDTRQQDISSILLNHTCEWISKLEAILANMNLSQSTYQSIIKEAKIRETKLIVKFKRLLMEGLSDEVVKHLGWLNFNPETYNWLCQSNLEDFLRKVETWDYQQKITELYARHSHQSANQKQPTGLDDVMSLFNLTFDEVIGKYKESAKLTKSALID